MTNTKRMRGTGLKRKRGSLSDDNYEGWTQKVMRIHKGAADGGASSSSSTTVEGTTSINNIRMMHTSQ